MSALYEDEYFDKELLRLKEEFDASIDEKTIVANLNARCYEHLNKWDKVHREFYTDLMAYTLLSSYLYRIRNILLNDAQFRAGKWQDEFNASKST